MRPLVLLALFAVLFVFPGRLRAGEDASLQRAIAERMEMVRGGMHKSLRPGDAWERNAALLREKKEAILPHLDPYLADPNPEVRADCVRLLLGVHLLTDSSAARKQVADRLLRMAADNPADGKAIYPRMLIFRQSDFSEEARTAVRKKFLEYYADREKEGAAFSSLILLEGIANIKEDAELLHKLVEEKSDDSMQAKMTSGTGVWWGKLSWQASKALARMGDAKETSRCLEMADSADPNQRVMTLFPQIAYIRQPSVVEYFKKHLFSEEMWQKPSNHSGDNLRDYAREIVGQLSDMVEGFPIESFRFATGKTDQQIILEVKQWFEAHPDYSVIR